MVQKPLQPWKAGDSITADRLNQLVLAANAPVRGYGVSVSNFPGGGPSVSGQRQGTANIFPVKRLTQATNQPSRYNANIGSFLLSKTSSTAMTETAVYTFNSKDNNKSYLWDLSAIPDVQLCIQIGENIADGKPIMVPLGPPQRRDIFVKITGNLGVETYTGKSYDQSYDFSSFDGTGGYTESLLGNAASSNDCIIVNLWSATDISDNILTVGGLPTKPFPGILVATTNAGKKVVFIDGQDPEACS